ncbi:MAG: ABC transporter permease [Candidatus Eisenbacteria sp.]|nr:ABC transporter permease [Candidatus Eisenbacteria bacterium]
MKDLSIRRIVRELGQALLPLALALAVGAVIILAIGENPLTVFGLMLRGSFGSLRRLSGTLQEASPMIFTGVSVALAFRAGLFNIGAEGQLLIGGFAAAWAGFALTGLPGPLHVVFCVVAAAAAGLVWGLIPGILKARLGVHEVINTIMLNYVALSLTNFLVGHPYFKEPGQIPQTRDIAASSVLPRFEFLYAHAKVNAGLWVALAVMVAVGYLLARTRYGFEIKAVGYNPEASEAAGISKSRVIWTTMGLSGAIAGLAGAEQVLGVFRCFVSPFPFGYGFVGIAVALLARNNPLAVLPAALIFGALTSGAQEVDVHSGTPREITVVLQGIFVLFIACEFVLRRKRRVGETEGGPKAGGKGREEEGRGEDG